MKKKILILSILFLLTLITQNSFAKTDEEDITYKELVDLYQDALRESPDDQNLKRELSIIYHNRAVELTDEGAWLEAIENEEKAYKLVPEEEIIRGALSIMYNSYGLELKDKGRFQKALQTLKVALEYTPEQPQIKKNITIVYLCLAYEVFKKNEYTSCRRFLKRAADFDENNPYIYMLSGEVAYKMDNYHQAERDWLWVLKLKPDLYEARLRLEKLKKERELEAEFKIKEIENFKLKFEGIENRDLAVSVANILKSAYREVGQDLDIYPNGVISVIIYPERKLQKLDYFPDWAAGAYDGKIRLGESIGKSQLKMKAVLHHEYTHVLVHMLAGNNAPLWLNEGLAEFEAKRFRKVRASIARKKMLYKAVRKKRIFSIDELGEMNLPKMAYFSPYKIVLVYAQCESFVTYLIQRSSLYDIRKLLVRLGQGSSIERAVKDILYVELQVLEKDWKREFDKKTSNQ